MEAVVEHVRENWSAEGAEVASFGKSSVTVAMPHEFRQLDEAVGIMTALFPVSTDLELTTSGANLYIQRTRGGSAPVSKNTPRAATAAHAVPKQWIVIVAVTVFVATILFVVGVALSRPRAA